MLSVSSAAVHRAIRPKTPESSPSPPSQVEKGNRRWNCEYTLFTKRRCRPSSARKKIIQSVVGQDATIGIDVHYQTVRFEENTPLVEPIFINNTSEISEDSSSSTETCRPSGPVSFLKSSQMQQRVKVARQRDEDGISKDENDDEGSAKNDEKIENNDEYERIFDVPNKRQKLENNEDNVDPSGSEKTSKMSRALSHLLTKEDDNYENDEEYLNLGEPGIKGDDLPKRSFPPIMEDNGWDSDADVTMLRDLREPTTSQDTTNAINDSFNEDTSDKKDDPHWMIGFPNPPGENRCWLNATLHALLSLPLIDYIEDLDSEQLRDCSQLTKTLLALRLFWRRGNDGKQRTHQTVKMFKESLGILDESYPSQRQQDVSEFLTMFLNYLKTDFEKLSSRNVTTTDNRTDETENIADNRQEARAITRSPHTPSKRPPLADISPSKRKFSENSTPETGGLEYSPKMRKNNLTYSVRDLMSPRVNRLTNPTDPTYKVHTPPHNRDRGYKDNEENLDFCKNPIDRYFLLHMMEHYVCQGCAKHRQRKVDNLMIYIDLLADNENEIVYLDKSIKNTREPEERTLTCGKCKYGKHKVFTTFRVCPKILMVQINRYGMCSDGSVAKFNTPVDIPETLQLDLGTSEVDNGIVGSESFEPVCVIAHVGSAMDCGHYTSYVRNGDSWYHYNDLMVTPMSRHEALAAAQTTAYVVFFASTRL